LQDLLEKAEKQPNLTIGILASIAVVIFTVIFRIIFGGKKNVSIELLLFGILFSPIEILEELFTQFVFPCAGKSGKGKHTGC
jgi:hypothetical protein